MRTATDAKQQPGFAPGIHCAPALRRVKFLAPFQCYFSFEILYVAADAGDCGELVPGSENYGDVFGFQIARYTRAIAVGGVTDVVHMQVEMVAPKKWWHHESFARSENVSRGSLTLALSHNPVFDANPACARIGPACNVPRGKNAGNVRFQKFVD